MASGGGRACCAMPQQRTARRPLPQEHRAEVGALIGALRFLHNHEWWSKPRSSRRFCEGRYAVGVRMGASGRRRDGVAGSGAGRMGGMPADQRWDKARVVSVIGKIRRSLSVNVSTLPVPTAAG